MPGRLVDLTEVVALRLQCVKCKNSVQFRFPLYQEVTLRECERCLVEQTFPLPNPDPWMRLVSKVARDIELLRDAQTDRGVIAAKWRFTDLMFDWNRKHSRVVFVPSSSAVFSGRKYNFLQNVAIAEQSDFLLFLEALSDRKVYFDPGTNVVHTRGKPRVHPRSQFRIKLENLDSLYRTLNWVSVCEPIKVRR